MADNDSTNPDDYGAATVAYLTQANLTPSEVTPPPVVGSYFDDGSSWFFSSHDIPILIGAAAGAIGLILIFLAAALIWHCCQFALQRDKSSYSLDNDSERNSVSSRASNLYINNPIIDEKAMVRDNSDQNLKRSISAPVHRQSGAHQTNTQTHTIKANDFSSDKTIGRQIVSNYIDDRLTRSHNSMSMELSDTKRDNDLDCHRSHIYISNSFVNDEASEDVKKCKSLPWSQSNKRRTVPIDDDAHDEFSSKINFSKKRKNRMRNDSAAAIALNRSGAVITSEANNKVYHKDSHKDTDTLVDNEAIVVYDERTAL